MTAPQVSGGTGQRLGGAGAPEAGPAGGQPTGVDLAGASFDRLWNSLLGLGRDRDTGGYRRFAWTPADTACRDWFHAAAADRGMPVRADRSGNLWAWWGEPGPGAVAVGSHLDSVPDGGAFDGPLGVVSAFAALDLVRAGGDAAAGPARPVTVVVFAEEEGARFGVACLGSRLATGDLDPDRARALTDPAGVSLAEAMRAAGHDPALIGGQDPSLSLVECFLELHIEQGRQLAQAGAPVGVGTGIWPHGRYRFTFTGEANHAGTTDLTDRRDPMLTFAHTVLDATKRARRAGARVTFGRVEVAPNGTNAVPSRVRAWLDARAVTSSQLHQLVEQVTTAAGHRASRDGTTVVVTAESVSAAVTFDAALTDRVGAALGEPPRVATQAGHDAGVLAARVPTAMLFVRNPTGVSHSPAEHADRADCLAGVLALARVLRAELAR